MTALTHGDRIISRCRDLYSGRNITPEWAAHTCGISLKDFMNHYDAYIRRLMQAIETREEWFLLCELEYLLWAGYMRPNEASKRFKAPQESIENWLEEKNKTGKKPDWHDIRMERAKQGERTETSEIRLKITAKALEPYTIDDVTNLLVKTSGFSREKVLEIQAENDAEWREKYGMTAKEMVEARNTRKDDGK